MSQNIVQSVGRYRWTICALLFFATTINYLDRQVLSLLAPTLSEEFGWSETDYANITAIFQFVYALSMLFAGRFIDKLGTKWGYAIAIVIWSLGAILHAESVAVGEGARLGRGGRVGDPVSVVRRRKTKVLGRGAGEGRLRPAPPRREAAVSAGSAKRLGVGELRRYFADRSQDEPRPRSPEEYRASIRL